MTRDLIAGETIAYYEMGDDKLWCRVKDDNPAEASMTQISSVVHTPEGAPRRIETRAHSSLTSTADRFTMDIECTLLENDRVVRVRRWQDTVRRELV